MAYNVKISLVAKADVRKAVAFHKKEASLKVARNFVEDYELTLKKIVQNPFFQIYYKDFRGLSSQNIRTLFFIKLMKLINSF
jgi:hypothetical protein